MFSVYLSFRLFNYSFKRSTDGKCRSLAAPSECSGHFLHTENFETFFLEPKIYSEAFSSF